VVDSAESGGEAVGKTSKEIKSESKKLTIKTRASGANDVDAYLAAVSEPARSTLKKVRSVIRSAVPAEATEGISYGIPAFRYNGFLVGYAAFTKHCSFFPGSGSLLQEFTKQLKGLEISKGTIRFPLDKPLPVALLKKLVKIRVEKNRAKKAR
jgi:uncharacterized protein YdhG (YjbR/CyaY superfamily)